MEQDDVLELRLYRERVVVELERRIALLREVDQRCTAARFALEKALQTCGVRGSTTARKQVEHAHRVKLRADLKKVEREKAEAKVDMERARERLEEIDAKLDEVIEQSSGD